MPRISKEACAIDQLADDLYSDDGDVDAVVAEEDQADGLYYCSYCNIAHTSFTSQRRHEGRCNYRHQFPDETNFQFGGETDNFEVEVQDESNQESDDKATYQSVSRSQVERQEKEARRAPQEEGLGYVVDATFARQNLSGLARTALERENSRNEVENLDDLSFIDECEFGVVTADDLNANECDDDSDFSPTQSDGGESDDEEQGTSLPLADFFDNWDDVRFIADASELKRHKIPAPLDPDEFPALYVAMLSLMDLLKDCSDTNVFDKVMIWVTSFASEHKGIFSEITPNLKTRRKPFLSDLRKMCGDSLPPEAEVVTVRLPSNNVASVPTYAFPEIAIPWLRDDKLASEGYLQTKDDNFCKDTFTPVVPISDSTRLDENQLLYNQLRSEAAKESQVLDESSAELPNFTNINWIGKNIEQLIKYQDSEKNGLIVFNVFRRTLSLVDQFQHTVQKLIPVSFRFFSSLPLGQWHMHPLVNTRERCGLSHQRRRCCGTEDVT